MISLQPDIIDYFEALVFAMEAVGHAVYNHETIYFGRIGDGTFFSGSDFDRCRWYPDTNPIEAKYTLAIEFGEELLEDFDVAC
jgi:hypothetical protein